MAKKKFSATHSSYSSYYIACEDGSRRTSSALVGMEACLGI